MWMRGLGFRFKIHWSTALVIPVQDIYSIPVQDSSVGSYRAEGQLAVSDNHSTSLAQHATCSSLVQQQQQRRKRRRLALVR